MSLDTLKINYGKPTNLSDNYNRQRLVSEPVVQNNQQTFGNDNINGNSYKKGTISSNIFETPLSSLKIPTQNVTEKQNLIEPTKADIDLFNSYFSKIGVSLARRIDGQEAKIAAKILSEGNLRNVASDYQKAILMKTITYYLDEAKAKDPALFQTLIRSIDITLDDFSKRGETKKLVDYLFVELDNAGLTVFGMNDWAARKIVANPTILNNTSPEQKATLLYSLKLFYTDDKDEASIIRIMKNAVDNNQLKAVLGHWSDNLSPLSGTFDSLYSDVTGKNRYEFLNLMRTGIVKENINTHVMTGLYGATKVLSDIKSMIEAEKLEQEGRFNEAGQRYDKIGCYDKAIELFNKSTVQNVNSGNFQNITVDYMRTAKAVVQKTASDLLINLERETGGHFVRSVQAHFGDLANTHVFDKYPQLQSTYVLGLEAERKNSLEKLSKIEKKELTVEEKKLNHTQFEKRIDELTNTRSVPGNRIKLLLDGPEAFERLKSRIENAKESIYIEVFLFHDDKRGHEIADLLVKRAKEGLDVRVILDGPANMPHPSIIKKLEDSKINFFKYSGSFYNPIENRGMSAYHRKVYIFDNKQVMTGGINIGDHYLEKGKWHDSLVEIEGPAMSNILNDFYEKYWYSSGKPREVAPPPSAFQSFAENDINGDLPFDAVGNVRLITTDPVQKQKDIKTWMLEAINNAHTRIMLEDPYFNDPEVINALVQAIGRGVKVDIIFPGANDMMVMKHLDEVTLEPLYAAGANIHNYDTDGKEAFNHMKAIVVDDMTSLGSANRDVRAMNTNQEINLVYDDKEFTESVVKRIFEKDIAHSVPGKPQPDNFVQRLIKLGLNKVPSLF